MIGDPVALTIRRRIERTPESVVAAFAGAQTSFIADAQDGAGVLDFRIKPLDPGQSFVGTAIIASGGPRDNLAAMAMLDHVETGDVLVIATGGDTSSAVIGDHYAAVARQLGVTAIVTDGLVRDADGIVRNGPPTFARGLSPNSGFRNGPGEVNLTVSLGGVTVEPGDVLVGDRDGVILVPRLQAAEIAKRLEIVKGLEAETEAKVLSGKVRRLWDPAKFEARGVRYLD